MKSFIKNINNNAVFKKIDNLIDNTKEEIVGKSSLVQNRMQDGINVIKQTSKDAIDQIEHQSKTITNKVSTAVEEQILKQFIDKVNLSKMISAIKALNIVDPKTTATLSIVSEILIALKDNKDGKGIEKAKIILSKVNIKDMIIVLQPLLGLIPYGNHLNTLLKLLVR